MNTPVENMTHVKYNLKEFEGSLIINTEKHINCTLMNKTLWKYNYFQDEHLFTCPYYTQGGWRLKKVKIVLSPESF